MEIPRWGPRAPSCLCATSRDEPRLPEKSRGNLGSETGIQRAICEMKTCENTEAPQNAEHEFLPSAETRGLFALQSSSTAGFARFSVDVRFLCSADVGLKKTRRRWVQPAEMCGAAGQECGAVGNLSSGSAPQCDVMGRADQRCGANPRDAGEEGPRIPVYFRSTV